MQNDGAPIERFEGEDWTFETKAQSPSVADPTSDTPTQTDNQVDPVPISPPTPILQAPSDDAPKPLKLKQSSTDSLSLDNILPEGSKRAKKSSSRVMDLISGKGRTSNRPSNPLVPTGIHIPSTTLETIGQEETDDSWALMMEDQFLEEYSLAIETADAKAIEPRALAKAKRRLEWLQWERGIHDELETLQLAETWTLVDKPHGANIVGSKWVFWAKKDAAGNVVRHKARLVA
jgi:hypothetical protein